MNTARKICFAVGLASLLSGIGFSAAHAVTCLAKEGAPDATRAWGKPASGAKLGIGPVGQTLGAGIYRPGEMLSGIVSISNQSAAPIRLCYFEPWTGRYPTISDAKGQSMAVEGLPYDGPAKKTVTVLKPGKRVDLGGFKLRVQSPGSLEKAAYDRVRLSPGFFQIKQTLRFDAVEPDCWSGDLQSGELSFRVVGN